MPQLRIKIPDPYWHKEPVEFSSSPMISQAEYERARRQGIARQGDSDELIDIIAPASYQDCHFRERRSSLSNSPTFAEFFGSPHYLEGTKTALWMLRDHAVVVDTALQYLNHLDNFETPNWNGLSVTKQVYFKIRLYFFAKRLRVPKLEAIAYEMLIKHESAVGVAEIIDLALVIYEKPSEEDHRIRRFLQRLVELNLRALINSDDWRRLLRDQRPDLAADMFQLVATVHLEGKAVGYPPALPSPYFMSATGQLGPNQKLGAYAMRDWEAAGPDQLSVCALDYLHDCEIVDQYIIGTNEKGKRGMVHRDFIRPVIEVAEPGEEWPFTPAEEYDPVVAEDESDDDDEEDANHLYHGGSTVSGRRDKASWILGMDNVQDVFSSGSPTAAGSVTTRARRSSWKRRSVMASH